MSFWKPDADAPTCDDCAEPFTFTRRRHHCRDCGGVFCDACTTKRRIITYRGYGATTMVRICGQCVKFVHLQEKLKDITRSDERNQRHRHTAGHMNPEEAVKAMAAWNRNRELFENTVTRGGHVNIGRTRSNSSFSSNNSITNASMLSPVQVPMHRTSAKVPSAYASSVPVDQVLLLGEGVAMPTFDTSALFDDRETAGTAGVVAAVIEFHSAVQDLFAGNTSLDDVGSTTGSVLERGAAIPTDPVTGFACYYGPKRD